MSKDHDPVSNPEVAARLAMVERQIEDLSQLQQELDQNGLEIAAIRLDDAIESLRTERVKLQLLR